MEYEYRRLSEEKARKIDERGFTDYSGKEISINIMKSLTNRDETIIFQQTWYSHEKEEPDKYLFLYKEYYYFVDIFRKIKSEKEINFKNYYYTYNITRIFTQACENKDYKLEEILEVLKNVMFEWNKFNLGRTNPDDKFLVEVQYKGGGDIMEFEVALERIVAVINNNKYTSPEDWEIIFQDLVGNSDAETITNVQGFIKKNFSFEIESGAEGYAYLGLFGLTSVSPETPIYKYVEAIVESNPDKYGYISSTHAGRLFNDDKFNTELKRWLSDKDIIENLYNGKNATGELFEGVQSLNDFFSENYINALKEPNLNTVLSGDYSKNCFGRTEFDAIMGNDAINVYNEGISYSVKVVVFSTYNFVENQFSVKL